MKKLLLCAGILTLTVLAVLGINARHANAVEPAVQENRFVCFGAGALGGGTSGSSLSGTGYDRLKNAVKMYGQTAMEMQREWGTPWEVVLAQMQKESNVGTAGIAVGGATNNWLGITGKGDAGSWTSSSGRAWAVYSSVDASIRDWAGPRILRNGIYDAAFAYLNPSSYDLPSFLKVMISHYAPNSDGNNETAYVQDVLSFINGPIKEAREEMSWPSSAELATQENIPIGGRHPLGTPVGGAGGGGGGTVDFSGCNIVSGVMGNIAETARLLARQRGESAAPDNPTEAYKQKFQELGQWTGVVGGSWCGGYLGFGASCDRFVVTVLYAAGVVTKDEAVHMLTIAAQRTYFDNHPDKWQKVGVFRSESDLQPGDVLSASGSHVMIYVGNGEVAGASCTTSTAPSRNGKTGRITPIFFVGGPYDIYRYKG